jgi:HprK-related kinase A
VLIGELTTAELRLRLASAGLPLITGAFTVHVRSSLPPFAEEFGAMYADFAFDDPPGVCDSEVRLGTPGWWRRTTTGLAMSWIDEQPAFGPVPTRLAYTIFETSLNWSIALSDVAPLFLHAAVLERDGRALLLPAPSASGKSTLCAALAWRGWRLFSDEMAIFEFDSAKLRPNPRPVSLKNAAIDAIRAVAPRASISDVYAGTPKGDVAYMRPPTEAVARAQEGALPSLVVSPRYSPGAVTELVRLRGRDAFELLTSNSVNYSTKLREGFDRIVAIVEQCGVYRLIYPDLDAAIEAIDDLHRAAR